MPSLLLTDAYKFSMAEAGFPLRPETFYYSHRKGGPQVLPVDVKTYIEARLPELRDLDLLFLSRFGYGASPATMSALTGAITVHAIPRGSVFYPGEPVFSVTGPSALVSWLEPLLLQLHYRIQIASYARFSPTSLPKLVKAVTCAQQEAIIKETLDYMKVPCPSIQADPGEYMYWVTRTAKTLVDIVGGGNRLFEVGLRAATCPEQHTFALASCRDTGITRTSNVKGANDMHMTPVGTMGHEHIQRFGNDRDAFLAMRDRRSAHPSFLLDTFDTKKGLETAFEVMAENRGRPASIRFDSGDKVAQVRWAAKEAREYGIKPTIILEDSLDAPKTQELEKVRKELDYPAEKWIYGYGGHLVNAPEEQLTRDNVAAVYKLSSSGGMHTMKFGNEVDGGKESQPGRPVVYRRVHAKQTPIGIISQAGEHCPEGYKPLTDAEADFGALDPTPFVMRSPQTEVLVRMLRKDAGK